MWGLRSSTSTRLSSSAAARSAIVSPKKPEPTTTRSNPAYVTETERSGACTPVRPRPADGVREGRPDAV